MLFNSWGYLLFLLLAVPAVWLSRNTTARVWLMALMSLLFYAMWRWEFCGLILFSALVDYAAASRIHRLEAGNARRKLYLLASLAINLGLLVYFKYSYFILENGRLLAALVGLEEVSTAPTALDIILPLGISFYTFQTISYTIDVYRGVTKPVTSFGAFLAFVSFWPQLIAGPVLRVSEVVPQLLRRKRFHSAYLTAGLTLIVLGLFKKCVLADGLAPMVEYWFELPAEALTALDVWVAATLFGLQIYFDFAGYSEIAIGSALLLGIRFPANFNWPYMATSPREFWARWHISLSSWIRDYLYLPLTGAGFRTKSTGGIGIAAASDVGSWQRGRALFLSWFIMGLWHGASWNFAVWGLFHAMAIFLFRVLKPLRNLAAKFPALGWGITLAIAMISWIPFRATDLTHTFALWSTVLDPTRYVLPHSVMAMSTRLAGYSYMWAPVLTLSMALLYLGQQKRWAGRLPNWLRKLAWCFTLAVMICAIILCIDRKEVFVYFQF